MMFTGGDSRVAIYQDPESRELAFGVDATMARARARARNIRSEIERASQEFYQTWLLLGVLLFLVGGLGRLGVVLALSVLVFLTGFVSRAWSHFSLQRLRYDRTFSRRRAFWGDTLDVSLRLSNVKPIPLPWVRFEDEVPEALWNLADLSEATNGRGLVRRTTSVSWYERVGYRFRLECRQRGYHRFGPVQLRSADLFGLFPARADFVADDDYVLVYPRLMEFTNLHLPGARPYGPVKGSLKLFEDPLRFRGLRDYEPNDPLKRIDWKASARRQDLQVRVYEPTASEHWLIVCNLQTIPSPDQGYIPYLLERAISTAASVAVQGARQAAVGLIANSSLFNSDLPIRLLPNRDPEQLHRVLEALAMASYISPFSINGLLRQESRRLPFGTTIIVVTALMDEGLLNTSIHLKTEGHPVAILYVGDEPVEPEYHGMAVQALGPELVVAGFV